MVYWAVLLGVLDVDIMQPAVCLHLKHSHSSRGMHIIHHTSLAQHHNTCMHDMQLLCFVSCTGIQHVVLRMLSAHAG
jgi:hypothetical protein